MTDKLPKMKLTLEGFEETQPKNLWLFSGNHRRRALGLYIADKKQKLEKIQEKLTIAKKQKNGEHSNVNDSRTLLHKSRRLPQS